MSEAKIAMLVMFAVGVCVFLYGLWYARNHKGNGNT